MNPIVQELINICDNLMIEYDNKTDLTIVLGNQEIGIDKDSGKTDNFYYPTVQSIIDEIENW